MTKVQALKRKADWLKKERRDYIDGYTEEWESGAWLEEWEKEEEKLRSQWATDYPDGTEDDWEEWVNRQLIIWQAERRETLRQEAQERWKEREAEYEKRWEDSLRANAGTSLRTEE